MAVSNARTEFEKHFKPVAEGGYGYQYGEKEMECAWQWYSAGYRAATASWVENGVVRP